MSRVRLLFAAAAIIFFVTPVALRAVGVTARPFENRPLATAPSLSAGWGVFDETTRFLVDRLPLREQAVQANTWTSRHIFATTPNYGTGGAARATRNDALPFAAPKQAAPPAPAPAQGQPAVTVLQGKQGWLYLEGELQRACIQYVPWRTAVKRWEQFTSIIRRSGRKVVMVVPPDKSTIYPEFLPATYAEEKCAPGGRRKMWNAIEGSKDPAFLPLRRQELAIKTAPPNETYFPLDTHWTTAGATVAVKALLDHLGGPKMLPSEIVKDRTKYVGDLANLIGAPAEGDAPRWTIHRTGIAPMRETAQTLRGGGVARLLHRPAGSAPLLQGRTTIIHDSFGLAMLDAVLPYVRTASIAQWFGNLPQPSMIAAIKSADTVILETVEREINYRVSDGGIVTPKFLKALQRALPPRRGS